MAKAEHVVPIPSGVSDDAAAPMLCAGVTVYRALKDSAARAGNYVAIVGAGGGRGLHACIDYRQ